MKSYNIAVEFNVPDNPANLQLLCMLCFSLPDEMDPSEVAEMFRKELLATIAFARATRTATSASTAILKAAKRVQDSVHCESFMLVADGVLSINLS